MVFKKLKEKVIEFIDNFKLMCFVYKMGSTNTDMMDYQPEKKDEYDTRGMKETCLNCGKKDCNLAGVGNRARLNENDGCWIPKEKDK